MKKYQTYKVSPSLPLHGEFTVPSDKSISHRAALLGALAEGTTVIKDFLKAEDTLSTLRAIQQLGIKVDEFDQETIIHGQGLQGLKCPQEPINCGNSGTSMRLLAGILAGQHFDSTLVGDESLSRRPMLRIKEPLQQMGANITAQPEGTPPLIIKGIESGLSNFTYTMPIASAQVKSALLLAGLYADEITIISPILTRDHTERLLEAFHYPISQTGQKIRLKGHGKLSPTYIEVPGDISSAAFFIVAATLIPGSEILLKRIGVNPYRIGVINILRLMGGHISFENETLLNGEYVADIHVRSATLHGIDIPLDQVPLAIDEFPVIFIAAACAHGVTVLRGAQELHIKETDRLKVMAQGLQQIGVNIEERPDGMLIEGGVIQGGIVDSCGDHRVAMSFVIAGAVAKNETTVLNTNNVCTSFPHFAKIANEIGLVVSVIEQEEA